MTNFSVAHIYSPLGTIFGVATRYRMSGADSTGAHAVKGLNRALFDINIFIAKVAPRRPIFAQFVSNKSQNMQLVMHSLISHIVEKITLC